MVLLTVVVLLWCGAVVGVVGAVLSYIGVTFTVDELVTL